MKKRLLAMLLALVMMLALLPAAALAADSDFVLYYGELTKYNGPGGEVTIPDGVTRVRYHAFSDCTDLTGLIIPASLTSIGPYAFEGCTNLTSIKVDPDNKVYTAVDGVLFSRDMDTLAAYPRGKKGPYTIPDSVTTIGDGAFLDCTGLTHVTIPDSVIHLSYSSFHGCTNLRNVAIPKRVTSIGQDAFSACTGLHSVTIPGIIIIGMNTFKDCTALTDVTIGNGLTTVGESAFRNCTNLRNVYYGGTEAQWKAIRFNPIRDGNVPLTSASIHYNSTMPDQPSTLPTVEDIPTTGTAVARTQSVLLDGKTVQFQYYAVKDANGNETNYVKIRDLAQALNGTKAQFNVDWDGRISITSDTPYVAVGGEGTTPYSGDQPYRLVSNTPVSFNGSSVNLTSFSITCQGRGYTYYKLRDLGQLLNFNVTWNGSSVVVETDKPYTG